ncbi:kinetochore Mis12-Ndc80 network component 2 [Haematobia irritans]|uniref:kinetochore Mis12-Ndc80 network component 2 n=1 Tax=Haematobia irritans TaxID=7368 RepID=UPI003F50200B
MDEKLQQILKIKPLQDTVIAYRNSTDEYRKMLKRTCRADLENLVNIEMSVESVEPVMPSDDKIPPLPSESLRKPKVSSLLKECRKVEEGIHLL